MNSNQDTVIEVNENENEKNITSRGILDFFSKNENDEVEKNEEEKKNKIVKETETETETETKTEPVKKTTTETTPPSETIIDIKPTGPTQFPELNLYEEEPLLKDIPFDIYDDSINLQPQNQVKNKKNYQAIEQTNENTTNINEINLYEDTPETKKTIFQKIKEIFLEIFRLISVAFTSVIGFIWALIGGIIMGIWLSIIHVYHLMLKAIFRWMFKATVNKTKREVTEQLSNMTGNIWDINNMIITSVR